MYDETTIVHRKYYIEEEEEESNEMIEQVFVCEKNEPMIMTSTKTK